MAFPTGKTKVAMSAKTKVAMMGNPMALLTDSATVHSKEFM
jgi:hypothetical protein